MALTDILFPDGDPQNFIMTMNRGNTGVISDILTEGGSNPGMLMEEWTTSSGNTATTAYTWVS